MPKSILAIALCLFTSLANAQEANKTILVLDASGSMWGQIDGKAKITIAQEVIGDLLQTLPAQQDFGLTAYGHRTKGSCTDIETIIEPGSSNRDAIASAVNAIKPKGKTPMTDAVIAAAQSLRHTEEKATVILVSDGIETCNPDPCAAARALEDAGVDFTAHVVGFNISDPAAIAQMQCLADETGGTFLSADNADELASALVTVAATPEPEPEPVPVEISFTATLEVNGPAIKSGLVWTFADDAAETSAPGGDIVRSFLPGEYQVTVARLEDETSITSEFVVEELNKRVVLVLPKITVTAQLEAVETTPIGSTVDVGWNAEQITERDYISIASADQSPSKYSAFTYVKGSGALPVIMPLIPGEYELRYIRNPAGGPVEILTAKTIQVTELSAELEAPQEVGAGSEFEVVWTGPNYKNDYISIALPVEDDHRYSAYDYTKGGATAGLTAPLDAGTYEIRYVANGNPDRVLGKRTIVVVENTAGLNAVDQAIAGSVVDVTWNGPDNKNDYISVAAIGEDAHKYASYTYTQRGSPAAVTMPVDPGSYELRYIGNGNPDQILAKRLIEIVAAEVSLDAPQEAVAGSFIDVVWVGPDNKNDYIAVASAGQDPHRYSHYRYTTHGAPAQVKMPLDPGTYELRYVANGNPDQILAMREIRIVAATSSLEAPDTAVAGSVVDVIWSGPDNQSDYISVAEVGQVANKYANYRYTANGSPATVKMPIEPGEYQLRYVANGNPDQVISTRRITVVAAEVALDAPAQGVVGTEIDVSYVGPDNQNDYISVAEIGAAANEYNAYSYTARGNPITLKMPNEPGTYLIRYIANGSPDLVLARRSIKVVLASAEPAVTAVLEAADSAGTNDVLEIFWVGPDADGDKIVITNVGSSDSWTEVSVSSGNPVQLKLPDDPGQYMLHYLSGSDGTSIGSRPLTIN